MALRTKGFFRKAVLNYFFGLLRSFTITTRFQLEMLDVYNFLPVLQDQLRRTPWPALKSQTWVAICYESAFLEHLMVSDSWSLAGFYWRSHFFIRGQLYREKSSGLVYRALNSNHHMASLWPLRELKMQGSNACAWTPDVEEATKPVLKAMLEWEDFEAAACTAVSPLGLVARGCSWRHVPCTIAVIQTTDFQAPQVIAARRSFFGCSKDDLLKLARENDIHTFGHRAYFWHDIDERTSSCFGACKHYKREKRYS